MSSKHTPLTDAEMVSFRPSAVLCESLEQLRGELGLERSELRVLDWGCGRGRTVGKLLEAGYAAYGIDVDQLPVSNGRHWFETHGYDPNERLLCVQPGSRLPFQDGFFHVIFSEQVLEHVEPLKEMAAEMGRLTAVGGAGIHLFPAKWRIVEPHLFMPVVHWLPKNSIRAVAIRVCVAAGIEPKPYWPDNLGSASERARRYAEYSRIRTFYRSLRRLKAVFAKSGFHAIAIPAGWPVDGLHAGGFLGWKRCARPAVAWYLVNFKAVCLYVRRRA